MNDDALILFLIPFAAFGLVLLVGEVVAIWRGRRRQRDEPRYSKRGIR